MLKTTSKGIAEFSALIHRVQLGAKTLVSRAFAEYIVGDDTHGLKKYPPYKHVPWRQVNGNNEFGGFYSDKQRRYVMAKIRSGEIDPGYSASEGRVKDAWQMTATGSRWTVKNDVTHAQWLMGDRTQSRHSALQGWRKVSEVIRANMAGALRHAQAALNEYIRKGR
jgi:hypothetical protein